MKRMGLIIPTLLGIMTINFAIIQLAPGGPVEQMIAKMQGLGTDAMGRFSASDQSYTAEGVDVSAQYHGAMGLDPALIKELEVLYGFDKPLFERYIAMIRNYLTLEFGTSYFKGQKVIELIGQKLPVSISLGFWSTLIIYLISIPLGVMKARKNGSNFDMWSSAIIVIAYAVPSFLLGIFFIMCFAGGSFLDLFPLKGLSSPDWHSLSAWGKITDYVWHLVLPVSALSFSGFAGITLLTKNSFLEEIHKQYVITARAKGMSSKDVLFKHVFKNAMLVIVGGLPLAFVGMFFTGSLLIEVIFSLDGLGLLGFEAAVSRDYPVVFGSLFIFTCISLCAHLLGDILYMATDPRIDFEKR